MSEQLEAGIEKLVEANEVLQNDLLRQQQTDRMRQQFVASVSHDFKTPIILMVSQVCLYRKVRRNAGFFLCPKTKREDK